MRHRRRRRDLNGSEDINRDLGFGSILSNTQQRMLNPDGSFNVERTGLGFWESLNTYHALITMPFRKFIGYIVLSYAAINLVFASLYLLVGDSGVSGISGGFPERFAQLFFFSIHTFSTIGYGNMVPSTTSANIMVSFEALIGLLWQALATGLLFARFSRPTPMILFSDNAVVAPYREVVEPHRQLTGFMFRIANKQKNELINLQARVMFAFYEINKDDEKPRRRFFPLKLERETVTLFPSTWTVVHPIDENSPMFGMTKEDMMASEAEILIQLTAIDETFYQSVHTRSSYRADQIIYGAKFRNIHNNWEWNANGKVTIDISRLNEYDEVELPEMIAEAEFED